MWGGRLQWWRLTQHRGNDLFQSLCSQPQRPCKWQVLPLQSLLLLLLPLVLDLHGPCIVSPSEENIAVLAVTVDLVFFFVVLRSCPMNVVGGRRAARAVCHAQFGACLRQPSPPMDPEHMVDDESPSTLLSRWNTMEVMRVLVSWGAERGCSRSWLSRGGLTLL